jgi:hypothetical protein
VSTIILADTMTANDSDGKSAALTKREWPRACGGVVERVGLTAEIVDFPGGIPGDARLTLTWA